MTMSAFAFRVGAGAALVLSTFGLSPAAAVTTISSDTTIDGVTLDFSPGGPYSDQIRDNSAPDGTTVTLITDSGYLIDYIGSGLNGGLLTVSGGMGFAFVSSTSGEIGSLTIDPQGDVGFTALDFNLSVPTSTENGAFYYGDISLNILGSPDSVLFEDVLLGNGENKFGISAIEGIVFSSITFSDVMYDFAGSKKVAAFSVGSAFDSVRQVSGEFVAAPGAVPEPGTWGMMLLGFGLVGAMVRRKRSARVALLGI